MKDVKQALFFFVMFFASSFLSLVFAYGFRLLLARGTTPEEYGLFFAILSIFSIFAFLQSMGQQHALVKFIPEFEAQGKKEQLRKSIFTVFSNTFILTIFTLIIIFLFIFFFKKDLISDILGRQVFLVLLIFMLGNIFFDIIVSTYHGLRNFKMVSLLTLLRPFFILSIFLIVSLSGGFSALSAAIAYALAPFIVFLLFFPGLISKVKPILTYSKDISKKFFGFGIPLVVGIGGKGIILEGQTLLLVIFLSLRDVGLFSVALPTSKLLFLFETTAITLLIPMASRLHAKGDKKQMEYGMKILYKYLIISTIPIAVVMASFSETIILLLYGAEYIMASTTLSILSFGAIFWIFGSVTANLLVAIGETKKYSSLILITAVANLFLGVLLIPLFGLIGAAFALVISNILLLVMAYVIVKKHARLEVSLISLAKTIFSAIILFALIKLLAPFFSSLLLNLYFASAITLLIAGAVYVVLLFLLGEIRIEEVKMLLFKSKEE